MRAKLFNPFPAKCGAFYCPGLLRLQISSPCRLSHSPSKALQLEPQRCCVLVPHLPSGLKQSRTIRHGSSVIYEHPLISGIGAVWVSVEASTPVTLWIRQPSIHHSLLIGTPVLRMERGSRQAIGSLGGGHCRASGRNSGRAFSSGHDFNSRSYRCSSARPRHEPDQ